MSFQFLLPDIGEGVVEGEIVAWHFQEGDFVAEDDALVEVMTDKATVTIPSPRAGRLVKRFFEEGQTAPVGQPLVTLDTSATTSASAASAAAPAAATAATSAPTPRETSAAAPPVAPAPAGAPPSPREPASESERRALAAPATRKLAHSHGVNLAAVEGSGKHGRVTKTDVQTFLDHRHAAPAPGAGGAGSPASVAAAAAAPIRTAAAPAVVTASEGDRRVPIRGLRKRIYDKMAQSMHTAAHFTYVDEVDMTSLVATRKRLVGVSEERGAKLTYLPFFLKATGLALQEFPTVNATVDDAAGEVILCGRRNVSMAVATDQGLTVPVVHDVDRKSLLELASEVADKAERARLGQLRREDFAGGSFTITSLGHLGGMFATPILNYPEVGILGIHKIEQRPVIVDGSIVIRHRMYLSSSFDHRVVDGHVGAAFVARIKELLEDTDALLLELR